MKLDMETLSPWADVHRILSNMKTLEVTLDGKTIGNASGKKAGGEAELLIDEHGNVTLALGKAKKAKK